VATRPCMLLLIDENVPNSVAEIFASRGHEVRFVRDLFPAGTPDPVIATIGERLSAIVVTWDRDFEQLVKRIPEGNPSKIPTPRTHPLPMQRSERACSP
jgi:predicted nuclease of predicted toxin-antitoxin system